MSSRSDLNVNYRVNPLISNYDVSADGESVAVLENGEWLVLVSPSGGKNHFRLSALTYVGYRKRREDNLLTVGVALFLVGIVFGVAANAGQVTSNTAFLAVSGVFIVASLVAFLVWWFSERMRVAMQFNQTPLLIIGTPKNMGVLVQFLHTHYGLD